MKMAILELEYKNIRKITALKLPFTKADGSVISNNFIMMANGTGKTTTMELIKGLFDGTAAGWTASKVRSFAPTLTEADTGEFSITVKFDDRQYKYFLSMNYKDGTVQVETSAPPKGREAGLRLPESIRGIFTPEFVRRFVFDGEQAAKSMDSSSNEADETIRYLYRLDELDEILAANQRILTEIQNAEGKRGTSSSLSNLRTRQSDIDAIRAKLRARCEKLREEIAEFEAEKVEKEKQRQELDKSYEKLNQEKNDILKEQQKNRGEIDVKITSILGIIKSPYLLSESLCARMFELGNSMKKLKLPKTIAKDFFTELASADRCVCDRCIGERERTAIVIVNSFGEGKCKQTVWSGGVRCFLLTDYRRTDIIKAVMYMTIQQILREKNLSRYQLSKKSGVPWATLADICSGKTTLSRCSAGTLMKLSSTLDIPMEQLITLTVEKPQMHGGKPIDRSYLEKDLPASLDKALREYVQGEKDKVSYMDCLWGELYSAINSNQWSNAITQEQADYLRAKYL